MGVTSVRAKFMCISIKEIACSAGDVKKEVEFAPTHNDRSDNESWSKYTPSGELKMTITNKSVANMFKTGEFYYIDISPVDGKSAASDDSAAQAQTI